MKVERKYEDNKECTTLHKAKKRVEKKKGGWQKWCKHIVTNVPTSHRCVKIASICIRSDSV